ncbi:hypothetical protein [Actinomycetospora sp.]|uniref:hypothetical protein n=1 Tax=Actinomycetospora sp. TaxID=1872135 RepID=UPI0039C860BB
MERAPELYPGGQAVDARGVTREVIRRTGLDTAVRAACTDTAGAHTVDVDGNVLETHRAPELPDYAGVPDSGAPTTSSARP